MTAAPVPPLALTMGEPAGIGGEITLKAWAQRNTSHVPPFFVLGDPARLSALSDMLGLSVPIKSIGAPEQSAKVFETALPVLSIGDVTPVTIGKVSGSTAAAVLKSIDKAVALTQAGEAAAVVTNPIQKAVLYEAGFSHQGHTDYLASLCDDNPTPVMMLASDALRVVPVTVHIPIEQVPGALTREAIVAAGAITAASLKSDFGIENPKLLVAGLNPHAGEGGSIGREEDIIRLAINDLVAMGHKVVGPFPADSLFHDAARAKYDAALCMYHDQALIPIKTISFDTAVNVTLGLPFVRTSPDHGTALDIAGQGIASPTGLIEALKMAAAHAAAREKL